MPTPKTRPNGRVFAIGVGEGRAGVLERGWVGWAG